MDSFKKQLLERTKKFSNEVEQLSFSFGGFIYNPLNYGWANHSEYLLNYVNHKPKAFFLGMNPGPFGMAQTAVPFGEVDFVTNWMKLTNQINKPPKEHPNRPVLGLETTRSEVSGKRLWSFFSHRYPIASNFFSLYCVMNYCPLVFVDGGKTGKNIIPEKLPKEERIELEVVCDNYLDDMLSLIEPENLVGIGRYAEKKLAEATNRLELKTSVTTILHLSPSNPLANRDWEGIVTKQLEDAKLW